MEKTDLIPPGEILLTEFMEPHGISQTKLAGDLDIPQSRIADIIKGRRGVTVDTAMRLSIYFSTSVKFWLNLQSNYDIEKAEHSGAVEIITSRVRQNARCLVPH